MREHVGASRALSRFLTHWEEVKRRSPKTLRFYRQKLGPLFVWMAARCGRMATWNGRAFDRYVREHPEWSASTVRKVKVAAGTFAKWAARQNVACPDFAKDFEGPRLIPAKREAYTAAQMRDLLAASVGRVLELPVALAFWAGLSDGDIRALVPADIEAGWIVRPRSKTKVPMSVPVARPLKDTLARLADRPLVCKMPGSMSQRWASLCAAAKVPSAGGLKRLRHTFATMLGATGADAATIRDLMGHSAPTITDRYVHSDRPRKVEAIRRLEAHVKGSGRIRGIHM